MSKILEVVIISGENLKINGKPMKNNAMVTIRTDNDHTYMTKYVDSEIGNCRYWNEKMVVEMPVNLRYLTVEVNSAGGGKNVGTARIPVTDFIGDYTPENYLHFLSYRLRDKYGERNGIINISVRVKVSPAPAAAFGCLESLPAVGGKRVSVW